MEAAKIDYTELAEHYHLLFADWDIAIRNQAAYFDQIIRNTLETAGRRVLDATCGVGTQALGLAALGYDVTAADLCPASVGRLRREAGGRGVTIDARVTDIRNVFAAVGGGFDVVLSADNSLPHLLTDTDMIAALRQCFRCLRPGGLLVITVRDYAEPSSSRRQHTGLEHFETGGPERFVFQAWQWRGDTPIYDTTVLIVAADPQQWNLLQAQVTYRAWARCELAEMIRAAGFERLHCEPADGRPNKLALIARRPGGGADA